MVMLTVIARGGKKAREDKKREREKEQGKSVVRV